MNREDTIKALKKLGITPPDTATDEELAKVLEDAKAANAPKPKEPKPRTVKVRVTGQAVSEGGLVYGKGKEFENGDTFETTEERAASLGRLVEVIG